MKAPVRCCQSIPFLALLTAFCLTAVRANEADTALQLIDRMGQAAQSLNYEGVFVYLRNDELKAVQIIHKVDEEGEYERLVSLNGAPREIIRNNEVMTCILPDDKAVLVDERSYPDKALARSKNFHNNNGFPRRLPARLKALGEYYQFSLGKLDRVAGRDSRRVIIVPKDEYRYGYRLWVDNQTGLLLKAIMVGETRQALEQMMFASLVLPKEIPDAKLVPAVTGREFSWREGEPLGAVVDDRDSHWRVGWVPGGFALVAHAKQLLPSGQVPVEHLVYSDGLSSVSVFIERIIRDQRRHLRGFSNMGAVNAYGTIQAFHYLTVVGEVPHRTVERMGKSIRYVDTTNSDSASHD
jgi:sigma-E factor negative regulatory protein RseB